MNTLTVSIAGPITVTLTSWREWERCVIELGVDAGFIVTHSVAHTTTAGRKFTRYKPLKASSGVQRYSMASFFVTAQPFLLYASRARTEGGGVSLSLLVDQSRPRSKDVLDLAAALRLRLSRCVNAVRGTVGFTLPLSKVPANYAFGMNDIRQCSSATVLFYEAGGFIRP